MHMRKMPSVQPTDNGASWQPSAFYHSKMKTVGSTAVKSNELHFSA